MEGKGDRRETAGFEVPDEDTRNSNIPSEGQVRIQYNERGCEKHDRNMTGSGRGEHVDRHL